jgi:uncharacterized protein YeeX (DUF496 family)
MLTLEQFTEKLMGCMQFGLDEKTAREIVDKGTKFCDFYEKTVIAMQYSDYEQSGMSIDEFAIKHPLVNLELYEKKADHPEFVRRIMELVDYKKRQKDFIEGLTTQ